jgi:hypothetical protein
VTPVDERDSTPQYFTGGWIVQWCCILGAVLAGINAMEHARRLSRLHYLFIPGIILIVIAEGVVLTVIRRQSQQHGLEQDPLAAKLLLHYERLFMSFAVALICAFAVILDAITGLAPK